MDIQRELMSLAVYKVVIHLIRNQTYILENVAFTNDQPRK